MAVLLPMLVLSALHMHRDVATAADTCVECATNQPHAGHLTASTVSLTDCVLCQFYSMQYLEATVVSLVAAVCLILLTRSTTIVRCPSRPLNLYSSCAPPYNCFPM